MVRGVYENGLRFNPDRLLYRLLGMLFDVSNDTDVFNN